MSTAERSLAVYEDALVASDSHVEEDDYAEPEDAAQADRLLAALCHLERAEQGVKQVYDARRNDLDHWLEGRMSVFANRRTQIERLLEGWARAQHRASGGRAKTWKLPAGTLTLRAAQLRLEVIDDEETVALRLVGSFGPGAMKVQRTVVKSQVKARVAPGPEVDRADTPPGYRAHRAMVLGPEGPTDEIADGLILFVPEQDTFKATPQAAPQ